MGMSLLNAVAALLLGTTFLVVAGRRLASSVRLVAFQSLLIALFTALAGLATGDRGMIFAAMLVLVVKALAVPSFLFRIIRRIGADRQAELTVNTTWSLILSGGVAMVAYRAASRLATDDLLTRAILPVALAMLMTGLFVMISRRTALMQVVGLLVLENGLFLTALAMTEGMPLLVELGISFDLLVAGIVLGVLVYRIHDTFESIDVNRLRSLRG